MIDAIILAAGLGTRMGTSKPLLQIDGEPALARLASRLRAAGIHRPIVVLGHESATILASVDLSGCCVAVNPDPARGLSSSLRLGLASVSDEAVGALILHADMPAISSETIRAVLAAAQDGAKIAAPVHRGIRGFPVYFDRACVADLTPLLIGDRGARDYITTHAEDLVRVEVDDPGCILDLDTPADLARVEGSA